MVVLRALVAMICTRHDNLHFLQGSTIDSGASTISQKLGDDDVDNTILWHMHLGHAGEKASQSLTKQGLLKGAKTCKLPFCEFYVLGK